MRAFSSPSRYRARVYLIRSSNSPFLRSLDPSNTRCMHFQSKIQYNGIAWSHRNVVFILFWEQKFWCSNLGKTVRFPFIGVSRSQMNKGGCLIYGTSGASSMGEWNTKIWFLKEVDDVNWPQLTSAFSNPWTMVSLHFFSVDKTNFRCTQTSLARRVDHVLTLALFS